jgi:hypothetical protein
MFLMKGNTGDLWGYTMLTYQICTSMALPAKDGSILSLAGSRPNQNPKKAKKTKGDFLDFIV